MRQHSQLHVVTIKEVTTREIRLNAWAAQGDFGAFSNDINPDIVFQKCD
jgi:hypothetical protein